MITFIMKKAIGLVLVTLFLFTLPAFAQDSKAEEYFKTAQGYFKEKKYEDAIKFSEKSIKENPDYWQAYNLLGNIYFAQKDYEQAFLSYTYALEIDQTKAVLYYNRGITFNALRIYDSAVIDLSNAIQLGTPTANYYNSRGLAFYYLSEYETAINDYNEAYKLNPDSKTIPYNKANALLQLGEYEQAILKYKEVISKDANKEITNAIINMLDPLIRLRRFQETADYYAIYQTDYGKGYLDIPSYAFYPKFIEAATVLIPAKNYQKALENLKAAEATYIEIKNKSTESNFQRRSYSSILALKGYVLEQMKQTDKAQQAYEQSLVINPVQPEVIASLDKMAKAEAAAEQNDNTLPVIKILEPSQNNRSISVGTDKTVAITQRIRGQAIDAGGIRSVMINNKPLKIEENGYFDTVMSISMGINVFTIVATDKKANVVSETIQLTGNNPPSAPVNVHVSTGAPPEVNYSPTYHAILIAETDYADKNIMSLKGPATDMRKIYKLLVNNYNFTQGNTDTLVNASKTTILETIINKANRLGENDNLFLFYAGHGEMIKQPDNSEEGFLVPQDALKGKLSSYISSDDLLRTIKYSKAQHILFVADACFAGSLFRDIAKDAPAPVLEAYKDKSRKLLASGNRTAVPDQSEFIEYFRLALQENKEKYITAEQLIDTFKKQYRETTHLSLQYFPIKNVEDLGGQFVFKKK